MMVTWLNWQLTCQDSGMLSFLKKVIKNDSQMIQYLELKTQENIWKTRSIIDD
jgi:hypothetical protein